MSKNQKYVVFWQDHIMLGFIEVSSTKSNAQTVKKVTDNITPHLSTVMDFKEFIDFLTSLRKDKKENWSDFSPTPKEVKEAKVDFLYESFVATSKNKLLAK